MGSVSFGTAHPVVLAASCLTGDYVNGGLAEAFFDQGTGAYIGSTEVSPMSVNKVCGRDLVNGSLTSASAGRALFDLERSYWGFGKWYRFWAYEYNYYGDPKYGAPTPGAALAPATDQAVTAVTTTLHVDVPVYEVDAVDGSWNSDAEFETGNLDLLEVPAQELHLWRSAGARLFSREELRIVYIGFNNDKPPFDDPRVRRALCMAVDIEAIIAHVLFGAAARADAIVPAALRGGPPLGAAQRYDPLAAAALLAEAGYPGGFEMEIWQRENPEAGRVLESVQGCLASIGVRARIVTREWSAFKQAVDRGTPDAFYLDWFADYPDAENFLVPLFHSSNRGGGGNRARYADERVDSLLDAAALLADPGARWALFAEAERIIMDDAPWIRLWFPVRYEVVSERLAGYRMPVIFNGQRFTEVYLR